MSFVLDQAQVFADFTASIPAEVAASLRPHITGPQAKGKVRCHSEITTPKGARCHFSSTRMSL